MPRTPNFKLAEYNFSVRSAELRFLNNSISLLGINGNVVLCHLALECVELTDHGPGLFAHFFSCHVPLLRWAHWKSTGTGTYR
jgi:hypothetical protein